MKDSLAFSSSKVVAAKPGSGWRLSTRRVNALSVKELVLGDDFHKSDQTDKSLASSV